MASQAETCTSDSESDDDCKVSDSLCIFSWYHIVFCLFVVFGFVEFRKNLTKYYL